MSPRNRLYLSVGKQTQMN